MWSSPGLQHPFGRTVDRPNGVRRAQMWLLALSLLVLGCNRLQIESQPEIVSLMAWQASPDQSCKDGYLESPMVVTQKVDGSDPFKLAQGYNCLMFVAPGFQASRVYSLMDDFTRVEGEDGDTYALHLTLKPAEEESDESTVNSSQEKAAEQQTAGEQTEENEEETSGVELISDPLARAAHVTVLTASAADPAPPLELGFFQRRMPGIALLLILFFGFGACISAESDRRMFWCVTVIGGGAHWGARELALDFLIRNDAATGWAWPIAAIATVVVSLFAIKLFTDEDEAGAAAFGTGILSLGIMLLGLALDYPLDWLGPELAWYLIPSAVLTGALARINRYWDEDELVPAALGGLVIYPTARGLWWVVTGVVSYAGWLADKF